MNEDTPNSVGPDTRTVYIAFALVFGAGMATAIGASVVIFLPHLLSSPTSSSIHNTLLNRYVLASSLGMSAGVMVYVSMIEIFQKSRTAFLDAGYADNLAYIYATSCFFAGVVIMMVRV
jgi:ZIP family zinc transporter